MTDTCPGISRSNTRISAIVSSVLLIIIAAIYFIFASYVPFQLDDHSFSGYYIESNGGSKGFSFSAWVEQILTIRNADNSRLSNLISPIVLTIEPIPQILPLIFGCCLAAIIALIVRFATGPRRRLNPSIIILVWTMMILFLPWRNNMLVRNYALNYICSAFLTLLFLYFFLRWQSAMSTRRWLVLIPLGFITAIFHEGFSITLSCGIFAWGILSLCIPSLFPKIKAPAKLSSAGWCIVVIFFVIALINFLCPGMITRFNNNSGIRNVYGLSFLCDYLITFLFWGLTAAFLLLRKSRLHLTKTLSNPLFIIMLVASLAGFTLSLVTKHEPRMAWWPGICAITGILLLLLPLFPSTHSSLFKILSRSISFLLLIFCLTQTIYSIYWQHRLYKENREILALLDSSSSGVVFYDYTMPEELPIFTLYSPARAQWLAPFSYYTLREYYRINNPSLPASFSPAVVPVRLRHGNPSPDDIILRNTKLKHPVSVVFHYKKDGMECHTLGIAIPFVTDEGIHLVYGKIYSVNPARFRSFELLDVTRADGTPL